MSECGRCLITQSKLCAHSGRFCYCGGIFVSLPSVGILIYGIILRQMVRVTFMRERESSVDLFDKYPNVIMKGLTYSPKEVSSVLKRVINIRWKFLIHLKKKIWGSFDNKFNKYVCTFMCQ